VQVSIREKVANVFRIKVYQNIGSQGS